MLTELITDSSLPLHSESEPAWLQTTNGTVLAFMTNGQIWTMNADGSNRKQLTKDEDGIEGFKFSPDGKQVIIVKSLPFHDIIQKNPDDLPKAEPRRPSKGYRTKDNRPDVSPLGSLCRVNSASVPCIRFRGWHYRHSQCKGYSCRRAIRVSGRAFRRYGADKLESGLKDNSIYLP